MTIEEKILALGHVEVVHENMSEISTTDQNMFAMLRRVGLGASDSSVLCGVNPFKKLDELLLEKCRTTVTQEELDIGQKEVVRKGRDLEPIILKYFSEDMGIEVAKPKPMYRIKEHPQLTINYDGVTDIGGHLVPVEAKFCSMYANKYWDRSYMIKDLQSGTKRVVASTKIEDHIIEVSQLYGIPQYYYTQVQQQMLGLGAEFAYFAVIFDKGWQPGAFKIFRDEVVQQAIIDRSFEAQNIINTRRLG